MDFFSSTCHLRRWRGFSVHDQQWDSSRNGLRERAKSITGEFAESYALQWIVEAKVAGYSDQDFPSLQGSAGGDIATGTCLPPQM